MIDNTTDIPADIPADIPKEDDIPTIALVDDDRNILASVSMALEEEGYRVVTYTDGEKAYDAMCEDLPSLAVLDIKMPRMDGMELLTKLRDLSSDLPVIFLTSKDEEIDEIVGLKMGADDYMTKPFSQRLLITRIQSLLRRNKARRAAKKADASIDAPQQSSAVSDLVLDDEKHLCIWKGQVVDLTVTEYLLIKVLAARPGYVKSRDQLMDEAYGEHIYVDDRTIDSHIKRLRKKFKKIDSEFSHIETMYGLGYKFKES